MLSVYYSIPTGFFAQNIDAKSRRAESVRETYEKQMFPDTQITFLVCPLM